MPRFYSNIRKGDDYAEDKEGEEFADLEAAMQAAEESLLSLLAEEITSRSTAQVRAIEICDGGRQLLAVVSLPELLPKVLPPEVFGGG